MTIKTGDRIPEATLSLMTDDGIQTISTTEYFNDRCVVLFSVPGAFTPTCSAKHLPGFINHADELLAAGADTIACMSVNDVFVMNAWGQHAGAGPIDMLADGNGDFALALGLEQDSRQWNMGMRSRRFALIANNGVITELMLEAPGEFRVSSAENVLKVLKGDS